MSTDPKIKKFCCETMAEAWEVGFVARWSVRGGIGIVWCDPEWPVNTWRVTPITHCPWCGFKLRVKRGENL